MTETPVDVVANLGVVRDRIAAACEAAGRDRSEVRLLPVSKTHGQDVIREVYAAGERMFGENRIQEAESKAAELADTDIQWSVIGHLQTNKAKNLVKFADEFQALDSLRLAAELDKRLQAAGRGLDVLIQVNSSGEPQKFGLPPEEVVDFAAQLGVLVPAREGAHDSGGLLGRSCRRCAVFRAHAGRAAPAARQRPGRRHVG